MNRRGIFKAQFILSAMLILCLVPGAFGAGRSASMPPVARAAAASITVTPSSAAVGEQVMVSGQGFGNAEQVQFFLVASGVGNPINTPLNTTTTKADGSFSNVSLAIPAGTNPGNYVISAEGSQSSQKATASLKVTAASTGGPASITVNPSSVSAGGRVTVSGNGFGSAEQVQFFLLATGVSNPTNNPLNTTTTKADGSFSGVSLAIPGNTNPGNYVISAEGSASNKKATANLTVTTTNNVTITVNASSVAAGEQVAVSGRGFGPTEQVQFFLLGTGVSNPINTPLNTALTNGEGSFSSVPLTIPTSTNAGNYTISAEGSASQRKATTGLTVTPATKASITVSPTTVAPNDTIQVAGKGYAPNEQVSIVLAALTPTLYTTGASQVPLGKVTTDGSGSFPQTSFKVPYGVGGTMSVVATGAASNRQANLAVTITAAAPTLTISAPQAKPGDSIGATGKNYQPGETVALSLVTLGSTAVLGNATVGSDGSFTASVKIPNSTSQGNATVVGTGKTSRLSASAPLTVSEPSMGLTVDPTTVTAGNTVKLTGNGFVPGETISIQISLNKAAPIGLTAVIANTTGAFTIDALAIPATLAAGKYALTAAGQTSGRTASADLTVQAVPDNPVLNIIDPSHVAGQPYNLTPGGLVTVSGANFPANASVVLTLAGTGAPIVLATIPTNAQGAFLPVGVTVPAATNPGDYNLQGVVNSKALASLPVKVASLSPKLTLSTSTLKPGAKETVTGTGYAPREQVVLALNGAGLVTDPSTILTDNKGGFKAGIAVPSSINNGPNTLTGTGLVSRAGYSLVVQGELPAATSYYFANGDTSTGTNTVISLLNSTGSSAKVDLTFLYADQSERKTSVTIPAKSPLAVDLALAAGSGRHVSTIVTSSTRITAQATVYFKSGDNATSLGATAPGKLWYLAEGYTGGSFQEFVVIANPSTSYANVDARFLPFNGKPPKNVRFTVPPRSNLNVDTNKYMPGLSFSMIITSDQGVIVDRTMRFGKDHRGATVGHGSAIASTVWQFAQGTSSSDRQTFLTILNPNQSSAASVTATFYDSKGNPVGNKTITVDALRRGNIKLNDVLPKASVAMLVSSNVPVVVERPLYIGPSNLDQTTAGVVVLGRNGGGRTWIFPGGSTLNGQVNDYFFYNTGLAENTVTAIFYTGSGQTVQGSITLAPNSTGKMSAQTISGLGSSSYGAQFNSKNGQVFVVEQRITTASGDQIDGTQGIAG